jgi:hypothetical protein
VLAAVEGKRKKENRPIMNTRKMPDFEQYAAELKKLEDEPPAAIELPVLAAIALINHVQLAIRHPGLADKSGHTKMAIDVALQLQALFSPESAIYKVLELGWDAESDLPRVIPLADLSWAEFFETSDDDDDEDGYVDDDEHNFSGSVQLCRQDYPDDYDLEEEEEEKYTNERAIALYGDNYGPVKEKDPQLMEAIKNYFEREGIDLDSDESIDNYMGEVKLDTFIDD